MYGCMHFGSNPATTLFTRTTTNTTTHERTTTTIHQSTTTTITTITTATTVLFFAVASDVMEASLGNARFYQVNTTCLASRVCPVLHS